MSDPTTKDYTPIPDLTADEEHRALLTLVSVNADAKPMEGAASIHQLIEMLGLDVRANELRAQKGLRAAVPSSPVSVVVRDSTGRIRSPQPRKEATPPPVRSGQHGYNGKCASGEHDWAPENVHTNPTTNKTSCRPCNNARRARNEQAKRAGAKPDPRLGPGERWCGCRPTPHILTVAASDTTYVTPGGKRRCRTARHNADLARRGLSQPDTRRAA